ncbi:hypothetical protein V8E36_000940 [Tilletia maclaganii]
MAPVAAVFTATGTQGRSVVRALAERFGKSISIRALTSNPTSPHTLSAFKEIEGKADIDIVRADISDPASIEAALRDVDLVFGNANSFDDMDQEVPRMKKVIDIAKDANVKLVVWSTLPSPANLTNGRHKDVQHFENKALIQDYLEQSGLKYASLALGFFADNFIKWPSFSRADDGEGYQMKFPVLLPDTKVAWTWVHADLGPAVAVLFKAQLNESHPELFKRIWALASYQGSLAELVNILSERSGAQDDDDEFSSARGGTAEAFGAQQKRAQAHRAGRVPTANSILPNKRS